MQLSVADAARLLDASEDQIYAWIREGSIPFYEISEQYRFHRAELLEWATANGHPVSVDIFHALGAADGERPDLVAALSIGGVHHGVVATDKRSLIDAVVSKLPISDPTDLQIITDLLMARDHVTSTVGDGIAIPHVQNPIILHGARAAVCLCFLEKPVEVGSIDKKPIDTVFMLATPTARAHLQLLSQVSAALHDEEFRQALAARAPVQEIMSEVRRLEASFRERKPSKVQ